MMDLIEELDNCFYERNKIWDQQEKLAERESFLDKKIAELTELMEAEDFSEYFKDRLKLLLEANDE